MELIFSTSVCRASVLPSLATTSPQAQECPMRARKIVFYHQERCTKKCRLWEHAPTIQETGKAQITQISSHIPSYTVLPAGCCCRCRHQRRRLMMARSAGFHQSIRPRRVVCRFKSSLQEIFVCDWPHNHSSASSSRKPCDNANLLTAQPHPKFSLV